MNSIEYLFEFEVTCTRIFLSRSRSTMVKILVWCNYSSCSGYTLHGGTTLSSSFLHFRSRYRVWFLMLWNMREGCTIMSSCWWRCRGPPCLVIIPTLFLRNYEFLLYCPHFFLTDLRFSEKLHKGSIMRNTKFRGAPPRRSFIISEKNLRGGSNEPSTTGAGSNTIY